MTIICTIDEYYNRFVSTAESSGAPDELVTRIKEIYKSMMADGVWKAPEQIRHHQYQVKVAMANAVLEYAKGDEPWCLALKEIFETYKLL